MSATGNTPMGTAPVNGGYATSRLHRVARGYWPCVFSRTRPSDVIVVRCQHTAASVCRNAWRRGYTVWRERRPDGRYELRLAHEHRIDEGKRRLRR